MSGSSRLGNPNFLIMASAFYQRSTCIKSIIVIWPLVVAVITLRCQFATLSLGSQSATKVAVIKLRCHLLSLSRHGR